MTLKQVIEALLFASPKPLSIREIVAALRTASEKSQDQAARDFATLKESEIAALLLELQTDYANTGRAFQLVEQVHGWSLVTDPRAAVWVRQLYPEAKPVRLSGPALETLAIIAYRQPVTRADIEAVRGVAVDGVMQLLLDRGLVKIAGRAEVPGRPLLYQTTEYFLQHFGLKALDELPNAAELKRVPLPLVRPAAETKRSESAPDADAAPGHSPSTRQGNAEQNAKAASGESRPKSGEDLETHSTHSSPGRELRGEVATAEPQASSSA